MIDIGPSDVLRMDDDVALIPADEAHLRSYKDAQESLSRFQAPQLVDPSNPREKLFVAAFDGTGNDADNDPLHKTNVARIRDQVRANGLDHDQVYVKYLAGPGAQPNPLTRTLDGALGSTYEQRLEEMYSDLVRKTWEWKQADPDDQQGDQATR